MLSNRLIFAPLLLCFLQAAYGGERVAPAMGHVHKAHWVQLESSEGLISTFPALPRGELVRQLGELGAVLREREASLEAAEEKGRFDAKDAMITLVMPGGLLYAAYRQHRHHRIKSQKGEVISQLEQLDADLLTFRVISSETLVAAVD